MNQHPTQKELNLSVKVALYPRVSTQEQAVNGYSIDEQIERMTKYCEAMNWAIYKVYTDAGYSGATTERPALKQMIKDIKKGRIDKVLVYKLDRLSRSQKDTLVLIEDEFLANGCDFVSMSENFNTSTAFGKAMLGILAVFAELEKSQIKERMSMGRDARAKEGRFHGSSMTPIGYDYDGGGKQGKLLVNEFEKIQIQKVFEMYSMGKGCVTIEKELNKAGYTHKYGKWKYQTVNSIISKKTYLGYIMHNGKWYKGDHEPIISEELYEKAQAIAEQRRIEHKKQMRVGRATTYLSGYLTCSYCGAKFGKLNRYGKKKGQRYEDYGCYSRIAGHMSVCKDPNCQNKIWRMNDLNNLVFDEIRKLALDPEYISEIKASNAPDDRPQIIEEELEKIDEQINRLLDLYTIGQLPIDVIQERIQKLNEQKEKLESELEHINEETEEKMSHDKAVELVQSFGDVLDRGDLAEIRTVIGALVDNIEIDGENVTIHWSFA